MRFWIDLDNSPHVHFFAPLIRRLEAEGFESIVTVRDFAQTVELARSYGLRFSVVGNHQTPRATSRRITETIQRAGQLACFIHQWKPHWALGHGSRAMLLAAGLLRIPSATFYDYEFVSSAVFGLSTLVLVPDVIPPDRLSAWTRLGKKLVRYPGLKEEVYIYDFQNNAAVVQNLNLNCSRVIITVRPPATWAHYHNVRSEELFDTLMRRLTCEKDAQVVVLARTEAQWKELTQVYGSSGRPFLFPAKAVDALSLMSFSDFVFSGGGTMSREAALLGATAFSTFGGRLGAADESLARSGRLVLLRSPAEIKTLDLRKRQQPRQVKPQYVTRDFLIKQILRFTECDYAAARTFQPKTNVE